MSITHPDDVKGNLKKTALIIDNKIKGFNMKKRYIRPNGSIVWAKITVATLGLEYKGKPSEICMIEDITEQNLNEQVSALCKTIGIALNLPEREIEELKTVGLLHDIGKIAIEEATLNKQGKLTEDEWEEIKRHPEIGYRILSTVNDMSEIAEYTLCHHERWDGKGYPKGLKGEEIPFQARIIAVADAYDAMTSERSYRSALPEEIAIQELQKNSGSQFDSKIVSVFIIVNTRAITFDYFSSYGEKTKRTVEPLQLWFKDKSWYLKGHCLSKQAFRTFKLTRMKNVFVTEKSFQRELTQEFKNEVTRGAYIDWVDLKLRLKPWVAYRVYDEFDETEIFKNSDGSFDVTVSYPEDEWVYGYILSFGSFIEVIEPIHIKDIIIGRLEETLKQYKSKS